MVKTSQVVFDEKNPNKMTEKQVEALNKNIHRYGFAIDPWLNDIGKKKFMCIDGENRIRMLMAIGIKEFPAKVFKVSYADVQMLRQIANKLRGEHDKELDIQAFKGILDAGLMEDFNELMAKPTDYFEKIIENDGLEFLSENIEVDVSENENHQCIIKDCDHGKKENQV